MNSEVADCDRTARELEVLASGYVKMGAYLKRLYGGYGKGTELLSGFFSLNFHVLFYFLRFYNIITFLPFPIYSIIYLLILLFTTCSDLPTAFSSHKLF